MAQIQRPTPIPAHQIELPDTQPEGPGFWGQDGTVVARAVAEGRWQLVWGRAALSRSAERPLSAWVVECPPVACQELQEADTGPTPPWHALAAPCAALRALRLPNHAVAALLRVTPAEVSRLTRFAGSSPVLKDAVAAGHLTPGHARILSMLSLAEQPNWTGKALAHRWSVRQLEAALADERAGVVRQESPDTASFLVRLGEVLGTRVVLEGGQLRLACYSVEEAKGLMERLAAGPEITEQVASVPAWLCVPAANNDQLHALTGHLVTE